MDRYTVEVVVRRLGPNGTMSYRRAYDGTDLQARGEPSDEVFRGSRTFCAEDREALGSALFYATDLLSLEDQREQFAGSR